MTKYFTDFSEYTTNQEPSDWTDYWTATTFVVGADIGYTGGKYCAITELSGYDRTGYAWDDIGSSESNVEIVLRFNSKTAGILLPALRASGTTSRSGYVLLVRNDNDVLDIRRSVSSSETSLGTQAITMADNTLYWVRFRANGDNIKAKFWADGSSEPSSWTLEVTDSSESKISTGGRVQIGTTGNTSSPFWIDICGVGTNGDSAPLTDLTPVVGQKYALPPFRRVA